MGEAGGMMLNKIILSVFLMLGLAFACYGQVDQTLTLAPTTQQFTITLPANPTTGYSWALIAYDNNHIKVVSHTFAAPSAQLPGAPGQDIWVFQVMPGAANVAPLSLQFRYARPWDVQDNPSFKTISILFQ